jgi:hypothetical protein
MATVTIIMPTYERTEYLRSAIASALAQTYTDWVLQVGDNSATDAVERVVRSFDDPRIRYHRNAENLGAHGNWLNLIDIATTPLVASLHDDDIWEPDFLARTVPMMLQDETLAMVFTDYWSIDSAGRRLPELTEQTTRTAHRHEIPSGRLDMDRNGLVRVAVVWNAPQPAYAAVLRRSAALEVEYPAIPNMISDLWLSYSLARAGAGIAYVAERLTNYRVHGGSVTATGLAEPEDAVFSRIVAECAGMPVTAEVHRRWAELRWGRAIRLMADSSQSARSRREMRLAAPWLSGTRRVAAHLGGRSGLAWRLLAPLWRLQRPSPEQPGATVSVRPVEELAA